MNYADMYQFFLDKNADAVVGAIEWPREQATDFGVLGVDETMCVHRFEEKP